MVDKVKLPDQKILLLDIEWRPVKAYVWRAWDESVQPDQIIEDGGLLCVGAKWLGEKRCEVFTEWELGHEGMLKGIHDMMSFADAIVTYNGDKYDLPKLDGEFVRHGIPPRPNCSSIDCIKAVKKFGYFRNSLGYVAPFLGLGSKLEHEGFRLWRAVMEGNEGARRRMSRYCEQDVRLLERLYLRIRPYIRNHPHLGKVGAAECPSCGGTHSQSRGTRRTRAYKIQRLQCQSCGHWYDGIRSALNKKT